MIIGDLNIGVPSGFEEFKSSATNDPWSLKTILEQILHIVGIAPAVKV